jgi:hypothetical protein
MRSYFGRADRSGLSDFVAEDKIPASLPHEFVRGWATRPATVSRAVIDEDAAEASVRELVHARPDAACGLLLNRDRELVPLPLGDEAFRA